MRAAAMVAACAFALSLAGHAQQTPSQPQATFQSGVDVVQVDVSVLDKDRRPVRGLTTADFTILEDGRPRPIVAFTAVDLPAAQPAAPGGSWMRDVPADSVTNAIAPEGRLLVILMDRTIRPQLQPLARRTAAAALAQLGPNDLAAVIFSGPGVPQNFTADRTLMRAAINRPFVTLPEGDHGTPGECFCGICTLEAMTRVAEVVRDVPQRRKSLLFIGDEVGILDWEYEAPISVACEAPIKPARERLTRAAQAANLTIHAIDPRGLETGQVDASSSQRITAPGLAGARAYTAKKSQLLARLDTLRVLADTTDGRTVLNTNAPDDWMTPLFRETSSYYVLGFQSATTARDGRFHPIEVKVNRKGLNVQARRGHYAPSADEAPSTLADAVKDLLPKTGLQLTAAAAPFAARDGSGAAVLVALNVRQTRVEPAPMGPEHVEILAGAFDREGRSPGWLRQSVDVGAPDVTSGTVQYEAASVLHLRPGAYEIRVGAEHREAARTGSVYTYVEVPDFAKEPLSMSGVVLGGGAATLVTPTADFGDLLPFVPTSRRVFARKETVPVFARVYQGGEDAMSPVAIRVRVVDAAAKGLFGGATALPLEEFDANRSAPFRVDVPLARMVPGEYLLTLEATLGARNARRDVRFTVR